MKRIIREPTSAFTRSYKRCITLIDTMLIEMQCGLRDPQRMEREEWIRFFGPKQSAVANLQKLVQSLATLKEPHGKKPDGGMDFQEEGALTLQDRQILSAWLQDEHA